MQCTIFGKTNDGNKSKNHANHGDDTDSTILAYLLRTNSNLVAISRVVNSKICSQGLSLISLPLETNLAQYITISKSLSLWVYSDCQINQHNPLNQGINFFLSSYVYIISTLSCNERARLFFIQNCFFIWFFKINQPNNSFLFYHKSTITRDFA